MSCRRPSTLHVNLACQGLCCSFESHVHHVSSISHRSLLMGLETRRRQHYNIWLSSGKLQRCPGSVWAIVWSELTDVTWQQAAIVLDFSPCTVMRLPAQQTAWPATTFWEQGSWLLMPFLTCKCHSVQSTDCICCCLADAQACSNVWKKCRGSSLKHTWRQALSMRNSMQLRSSICNSKSSAYTKSLPLTGSQQLITCVYSVRAYC